MQQNLVSQRDLAAYVESRGYRTERLFNTTQMEQDGADLRVVGLTLIGPRRNRGVVPLRCGYGDLDAAKLWCDRVESANRQASIRRVIPRKWLRRFAGIAAPREPRRRNPDRQSPQEGQTMSAKHIEEAARQEAVRRGCGPRMADWFTRGAYAAGNAVPETAAPHHRPKRAWWLDGFRWARSAS